MKDITKYQGIIPAFYACYDDNGEISPERVEAYQTSDCKRRERCLCRRFFRRVYLSERCRQKAGFGTCNEGGRRKIDSDCTCGMQQYC